MGWCTAPPSGSGTLLKRVPRPRDKRILTLCPADVLRSQTQIYEAEYETEHNDHKHTLQENRRLRKKREEMRQQVALLQEQVVFDLF